MTSLSGRAIPRSSETFFWRSTSASARSARAFHRRVSRSSSTICVSRGSGGARFGPRFFGASPAISPRSRAARPTDRWELYNPSRRSKVPISPGPQVSASLSTVRLYSALNRRLAAFSATSTSGITTAAVRLSINALPCSALYIKLWEGQCLTHVGREGLMKLAKMPTEPYKAAVIISGQSSDENGKCEVSEKCVGDHLKRIQRQSDTR